MSGMFADWLIDTFLYTSGLIALVLLIRKPVSRYFGPQVAYALWALPLLRFAMPPLVLPACWAPLLQGDALPVADSGEPLALLVADGAVAPAAPAGLGFTPVDILLPLWVCGALVFLAWRAHSYLTMRRELLADARPVGEAGKVRLVETPVVASPLAFGVRDKVVALPSRFMALGDRQARDLAIAHELAHHRGHDLLVNILFQPLLALHWFNPLAWAGWRAMRRDQEAACDARVVSGRGRTERALYASVIAGFAGGGNRLALAAPMACPVLGEKSIIHRLKSLTSGEVPRARRRMGLAVIGLAALGLPLTASISYAQDRPRVPPAPPAPPPIERVDPDLRAGSAEEEVRGERTRYRIVRREGANTISLEGDGRPPSEAEIDRVMDRMEREGASEHAREAREGAREAREQAFEHAEEVREHARELRERALEDVAQAQTEFAMAMREVPVVSTSTRCGGTDLVIERRLADGRDAIIICNDAVSGLAMQGLREARRDLERDRDMSGEERQRAIRKLDEQLKRMEARLISFSFGFETQLSIAFPAPTLAPGSISLVAL